MSGSSTRELEFEKLLAGRTDVDLVWLLLELASDAYSDVDWLACLSEIDQMGDRARAIVQSLNVDGQTTAGVRRQLEAISRLLYREIGFHGNRESYYDPRNSYLHEVLSRRTGIPITLAIIYMAVARRAGLEVYGVGTPGHFVLGCDAGGETLYVDPFIDGEVLDRKACRARIEMLIGDPSQLCEHHFDAASPREITTRVLRNLKTAYALSNNWSALLPVQQRLCRLLPELSDERRDLGIVYLRVGKAPQALELLEGYLTACSCENQAEIQPYVRYARRLTAELN